MKIKVYKILDIIFYFRFWIYGLIIGKLTTPIMFTGLGITIVLVGGLLIVALDTLFIEPLLEKFSEKQGE